MVIALDLESSAITFSNYYFGNDVKLDFQIEVHSVLVPLMGVSYTTLPFPRHQLSRNFCHFVSNSTTERLALDQ